MHYRIALPSIALLCVACGQVGVDLFERCDVELSLAPAAAYHGDIITGLGGPFTEVYDTFVDVAGTQAEVGSVERVGCDVCDTCRVTAECLSCGACPDCVEDCRSCTESITFTVPAEAHQGATSVLVINRYGSSVHIPFTILTQDTGATGSTDSSTTLDSVSGMDTSDTSMGETGHTGDTATVTTTGSTTDTGHTGDTAPPHTGDTAPPHTGETAAPHTGDTSRPLDTGDTSATVTTGS